MKILRGLLLIILLMVIVTSDVFGQSIYTPFVTSITYQNVGTSTANVTFKFYPQASATPIVVNRTIAPGAGSSLSAGNGTLGLPPMFLGSVGIFSKSRGSR